MSRQANWETSVPSELEVAVEQVRAASVADEAVRRRILDFCQQHPDALHRTCLRGHLTGSALILDRSRQQVLLIHHAKLERWLQPGGHADGEGDLGQVAMREAEEETGLRGLQLITPAIDLDVHDIPERGAEPAHVHLDVRFLLLAGDNTETDINHEALDARWIGLDDPEGLISSEELRRLITAGFDRAATL